MYFQAQSDRSANFRPIEDIFEDLSTKLCHDGLYQPKDIIDLGNLSCVKEAFQRLAEYKGDKCSVPLVYSLTQRRSYL